MQSLKDLLGRLFGWFKEEVHHVEDDFHSFAVRFESIAERKAKAIEDAAVKIAEQTHIKETAEAALARAEANAKKVRDFFREAA